MGLDDAPSRVDDVCRSLRPQNVLPSSTVFAATVLDPGGNVSEAAITPLVARIGAHVQRGATPGGSRLAPCPILAMT